MFLVFGLFLMANLIVCSPKYFRKMSFGAWYKVYDFIKTAFVQAILWWFWWTQVFML